MNIRGPSGAIFSADRAYRWLLWRKWADASIPDRWFMVIGLNGSKADEWRSDPTVSQMVNRAKELEYTGLLMLNAYGIMGTYPSILKQHPEPVGSENMRYIAEAADLAEIIVCAWGVFAGEQGLNVEWMLREHGHTLHVFTLTKEGFPRHPRALSLRHVPQLWTGI